ncbi:MULTISPECIES: hypothetical protein [Pseudomonas]|uniref:Uncharacterized protein n=1 Tax=Pseudomonas paralactis TaxID=1615673 RepID=A0A0R3ANP7_9PSED|nr:MULTISPECIES: hypothetical protein [Pseudomonas]KRP72083.1 hypothetical protein TX23_12030 [Pseudomonas paralactis]MBJ2219720.1 hypothetical protein [Pseudomonas sp. MF7453]
MSTKSQPPTYKDLEQISEKTGIEAPVVNTPKSAETYSSPVKFSGQGIPGWWVYFVHKPIDGTSFGFALVDENGEWEFDCVFDPRVYKVFGIQTYNGVRSPWTDDIEFKVTA